MQNKVLSFILSVWFSLLVLFLTSKPNGAVIHRALLVFIVSVICIFALKLSASYHQWLAITDWIPQAPLWTGFRLGLAIRTPWQEFGSQEEGRSRGICTLLPASGCVPNNGFISISSVIPAPSGQLSVWLQLLLSSPGFWALVKPVTSSCVPPAPGF